MKRILVDTAAIVAGSVIFDRFIARVEGSDSGFIDVTPGIGLDDVARAATILATLMIAHKFLG